MNTDTYNKVLSQNLKDIRRAKGLTTVDVAKILGVSQAKVSYIEHCKGVLSARDIAVLAKRLDVPVTDFFRGLDKTPSKQNEVAGQLIHFGATLLAKPSGITLDVSPFEEAFSQALGFIEDDRLHKAFCAALITQASSKEIKLDRIFAITGNNPFLLRRIAEEAQINLQVIEVLNKRKEVIGSRAKRQISKLLAIAKSLTSETTSFKGIAKGDIEDLAAFVGECIDAKG